MKYIAKFEKISFNQFKKDYIDTFLRVDDGFEPSQELISEIQSAYDAITIPTRATKGSAGYDFVTPITVSLEPGETIKIPTGIRCKINESWVMLIVPRSSLGIKKRMFITNTIPVIDSDYYCADNEGHIFISITNNGNDMLCLSTDDKFAQAIFLEYGITVEDNVDAVRTGGIGSTGE